MNTISIPRGQGLDNRLNHLLLFVSGCCIAAFFALTAAKTEATSSSPTPGPQQSGGTPVYKTESTDASRTVATVATDAIAFYNTLSASQQSTLQLTYTTALARKWSNLPCGASCRNGIQLGTNLTSAQYAAAMQVAQDAFSAMANNGYDEFHQMNIAEAYLHANGGGNGYDSTLRWMAFLNTPSDTGAWMLQIGGHHYAANIAFNHGHVVGATPYFMGLEPKSFTLNNTTYDPLGDERDAFRAMLASLSSTDLATAHLSSTFSDCYMIPGETNGGQSTYPAIAMGVAVSGLTATQKNLVLAAIKNYTDDIDTSTGYAQYAVYESEIDQTYISYVGSATQGSGTTFLVSQGDYVRISGPHVWIEFSCQGGIVIQGQIHYHTVWRDRSHDYGVDLAGDAIDTTAGSTTTTGIQNISATQSLKVYPNPATSVINIDLPAAVSGAAVSVSDMNGRAVYSDAKFTGDKINVSVKDFAAGTYFVYVRDDSRFYSGRFVKQ